MLALVVGSDYFKPSLAYRGAAPILSVLLLVMKLKNFAGFDCQSGERKRKRSDPVLRQKPLHQQICQKGKETTQTTPQNVRLHCGSGPT